MGQPCFLACPGGNPPGFFARPGGNPPGFFARPGGNPPGFFARPGGGDDGPCVVEGATLGADVCAAGAGVASPAPVLAAAPCVVCVCVVPTFASTPESLG